MNRALIASCAAFAVLLATVWILSPSDDQSASAEPHWPTVHRAPLSEAKGKPNIVFIYSDDQNASEFNRRYMPKTMRLLGQGGTTFSNFIVAAPICCPSRVGAMTGQYPHNSGVYMNTNGFSNMRSKANNLGSWLQRAGYRTAWFGKFLQGYKRVIPDATQPAPGWDDWLVSLRAKYYDWKLFSNTDGKIKGKKRPNAYYTDVLTNRASRLARDRLSGPRPLFMVLNELAPHKGRGGKGRCAEAAAPAPRDFGRFEEESLPRPPSFNEADRSDKTLYPTEDMTAQQIARDRDRYRCRVESMRSMDRGIAQIYRTVERAGELDNTIFVFTSDNGLLIGEHALDGKDIPYEEGIRMPLAMRVPKQVLGSQPVSEIDQLTANIDLTPTLLQLAGAEPCARRTTCRTLDGRSLVPLLRGNDRDYPADRAIPIEGGIQGDICGFRGLRLADEVMLEDVVPGEAGGCDRSGDPELYDLKADPYQLDNLVVTDPANGPARAAELQARFDSLAHCSGIKGRDEPNSGGFCE